MQVVGKILSIEAEKRVNEKFVKRTFVLNIDLETEYPQTIEMEFTNSKCVQLDGFKKGDIVTVDFNLRGRQNQGENGLRTFNTLQAFRIEQSK